jgi:hypothetical protein
MPDCLESSFTTQSLTHREEARIREQKDEKERRRAERKARKAAEAYVMRRGTCSARSILIHCSRCAHLVGRILFIYCLCLDDVCSEEKERRRAERRAERKARKEALAYVQNIVFVHAASSGTRACLFRMIFVSILFS